MTDQLQQKRVSPYYERDGIRLYLGDCVEVLPELGESFDVLVTDPPYGVAFQSNRRQEQWDQIAGDDGTYDVQAALAVVCKSLKRYGHAYVFGPDTALPEVLTAKAGLIWDKSVTGMGDLSMPWGPAHEPITFAVHEHSKANRDKGAGGLSARVRKGSVLRFQRPHAAGAKRHPNEKPVALMRALIESSTCIGDTVLDPFAGSGSTLVAAVLEGRTGVGIEVDPNYIAIAASRLDAVLDSMKGLAAHV